MDIIKITEEYMSQNSYLVVKGKDAILIDAGATVEEVKENLRLFSPVPKLKAVLLTHCHFDHIKNLDSIISEFNINAYIFKSGKPMLYDEEKNLSIIDSPFKIKAKKEIKTFNDSQVLNFGDIEVSCFNTPGHSIDSSVFVVSDNMFTGDTVFKIGVGRTDMYSGNSGVLNISLERILNQLSVDIEHYFPGHNANFEKNELIYNITRHLGEQ